MNSREKVEGISRGRRWELNVVRTGWESAGAGHHGSWPSACSERPSPAYKSESRVCPHLRSCNPTSQSSPRNLPSACFLSLKGLCLATLNHSHPRRIGWARPCHPGFLFNAQGARTSLGEMQARGLPGGGRAPPRGSALRARGWGRQLLGDAILGATVQPSPCLWSWTSHPAHCGSPTLLRRQPGALLPTLKSPSRFRAFRGPLLISSPV